MKQSFKETGIGTISIRPLDKSFAGEILEMWNRSLGKAYHISEGMLEEKIFNDKDLLNEGSFLLFDNDQLAGMIVAKVNRNGLPEYIDCAWLSALVVDIDFQDKGYGRKLYDMSEERLKCIGIKEILLGGDLNNFFSGIPEPSEKKIVFFKNIGFTINDEDHYDLIADASKTDFNSYNVGINNDPRYFTTEMNRKDMGKLVDFFDINFPGRWKHEIMSYVNNDGDLKYVILLWEEERIAGFCRIYKDVMENDSIDAVYDKCRGGLGPIGISDTLRGRKLGNKLLHDSLIFLKAIGAGNIIIDWTILKDFYGQFGFKVFKTYRGASKLL